MIVVYPDGHVDIETVCDGTLKQLQTLVGGYIEMVGCKHPDYAGCLCNEEGKNLGLPRNNLATKMAGITDDYLVGPVVFFKRGEVK